MRILLILASLLLISCSVEPENVRSKYKLPPELSSCNVFKIRGPETIYVVKCEGKSTTSSKYSYRSGKHTTNVNVSLIED